ncbi:hypothetical protein AADW59_00535 [Candidatus Hodgkinia cicadicola]
MLITSRPVRLVWTNAVIIDCACAFALCKACWACLRLIVLEALMNINALTPPTQSALNTSNRPYTTYHIYTKKYDKTILATNKSQTSLSATQLTTQLGCIEVINRKLLCQTIINANQTIERITPTNLQTQKPTLNFIVDKSASMIGKQKSVIKIISTITEYTTLHYEINCYTTRNWNNSNAFKLWARTRLHAPGRVNDILYIKCGTNLSELNRRHRLSKENIDGEAIVALAKTASINIIISDNTPADHNTCSLNEPKILTNHLESVYASARIAKIKLITINACKPKQSLKSVIAKVLKLSAS